MAARGDVLCLKHDLSRLRGFGRETIGKLATDHQLDDLFHVHFGSRGGFYVHTVTHDGNVVGYAQDLLHFVGDINDTAAALFEHLYDVKQVLDLALRQRGRRLVKYNDLGVVGDRFCDLYHLPLCDGKRGHDASWVNGNFQIFKHVTGLFIHFAFRGEDAETGGIATEPYVIHHTALQGLVQLLVHHGNAVIKCLARTFKAYRLPLQQDLTLVLGINAKQTFHQRRFSRTVLAHQCVHGSGTHRKRGIGQGAHTGKAFFDVAHFQQKSAFLHTVILHIFRSGCAFCACPRPW